jgi:hypothetical protein
MMQTELWTYRETVRNVDLSGFKVEAVDGSIGKIDEVTYDTGSSYIVVDTGPWIFGKKVLLPAGAIQQIDLQDKKVYVDRMKEEIKGAPEFDPDMYQTLEYRNRIGDYYGRYYRRSA